MSIEETNYQDNGRTLTIIRIGKCNECGYCCGFENGIVTEGSCSHLDKNGKCLTYDKRYLYCEEHKTDHLNCINFPMHPIRKLNPKCRYKFIEKESGAEIISLEFADGEFLTKNA